MFRCTRHSEHSVVFTFGETKPTPESLCNVCLLLSRNINENKRSSEPEWDQDAHYFRKDISKSICFWCFYVKKIQSVGGGVLRRPYDIPPKETSLWWNASSCDSQGRALSVTDVEVQEQDLNFSPALPTLQARWKRLFLLGEGGKSSRCWREKMGFLFQVMAVWCS